MNLYLFQFIGKWLSILLVSLTSFFSAIAINRNTFSFDSAGQNVDLSIMLKVLIYNKEVRYDSSMPNDVSVKLSDGVNGLVYVDNFGNVKEIVTDMRPEITLIGTGDPGEYIGRMTGYGPDCPGCSATGTVSCRTASGANHSLIYNGITYSDSAFGDLKIVAAALDLFSCGTVLKIDDGNESYLAVVLDTGGAMRSAWARNEVVIDLAFSSGNDPMVRFATKSNVKYSVQRWGW